MICCGELIGGFVVMKILLIFWFRGFKESDWGGVSVGWIFCELFNFWIDWCWDVLRGLVGVFDLC